jgi:alpha-1,2-mannosyltransferase
MPGMILLCVLIAGMGLRLALIHPAQNYLLDFRAYYAAATAATRGFDPYDTEAVRAHVSLPGKQEIIGYLYPPPTLWLFAGFARLPYPAAQVPWLVLQLGLGVAALGLILRTLRCEFGSPASVLVGYAFLGSAAVWELFRWGQFDMIVVLLLVLAVAAMPRDRPLSGGVWLGLAVVAKVTPIVYLAVLAIRKRWKPAAAGLAVIVALLAVALIWPGYGATLSWLDGLRTFCADQHAAMSPNNLSLRGFVYRLFVEHPTHEGPSAPWIDLGLATAQWIVRLAAGALCLVTAAWLWLRRHDLSTAECVCAVIPLVLLLSPQTSAHHCVQLLLPLAFIIVTACRCRRIPAVDVVWITLIVLLFVLGSGGRIESATKPWLNHLIAPTTTYAVGLTWLFFVARFVPLKQTAGGVQRVRETARLGAVRPVPSHG